MHKELLSDIQEVSMHFLGYLSVAVSLSKSQWVWSLSGFSHSGKDPEELLWP